MLKKLAIIGLFTGIGQLFSIFTLRYLSQTSDTDEIAFLGQADSMAQFLISFIAFGLQADTMRNIALRKEWHSVYIFTQQARISLSIVLICFSILSIFEPFFLIFAATPVFAMNADYALYATGKPLAGAFIALARLLVPLGVLAVLTTSGTGHFLSIYYVLALITIYILTNLVVAHMLSVPVWVQPSIKSLHLYFKNLRLGLVTISLYFIGFGLVVLAPYFYDSGQTAVFFVVLKFYMIYKGVLRIAHQAFLSEMILDAVCLKLDKLSFLVALLFAGSAFIFPETMIRFFFGREYLKEELFVKMIAASALIYAFFLSIATKALLQRKDKAYTIITVQAAVITIALFIGLSFLRQSAVFGGISIFAGELVWLAGLIYISYDKTGLSKRLQFVILNFPLLVILLAAKWFAGDTLSAWFSSVTVAGLVILIVHYKDFKTLK
jgi:hypothetical protein